MLRIDKETSGGGNNLGMQIKERWLREDHNRWESQRGMAREEGWTEAVQNSQTSI